MDDYEIERILDTLLNAHRDRINTMNAAQNGAQGYLWDIAVEADTAYVAAYGAACDKIRALIKVDQDRLTQRVKDACA